jgi:hypothetical protein
LLWLVGLPGQIYLAALEGAEDIELQPLQYHQAKLIL